MKQFFKNLARFFYDQEYQASIGWVKYATKIASPIHHHIWTTERFPAGVITVLIYHLVDPWPALFFFILSALTDWFDGKVARFRQNPKSPMVGRIDRCISKIKQKKRKNFLERIIVSDNFGDVLDGTADKIFVIPVIWYLGIHIETGQNYWILVWPMIIIDALGNPLIKVLEKTGKIQGGGRIYKHSIAGKIKYALQVVLITLLWIKEVFPYEYEEVAIYFVLSITTVLAFFSVFCKVKPLTCEKIWRTSNGS